VKLNLGACDRKIVEYLSVDIVAPADIVTDLSKPWPWADSSIQAVKAFDIIEHIEDKIHFMNELHRVLIPGGKAEIEVPNATHGAGAFQDPTHCSFWTMNSFQYFEERSSYRKRFAKAYGITARFNVLSIRDHQCKDLHEPVWKIGVVLEAVK
jgi:predicted SAM-dependent methyltransferase